MSKIRFNDNLFTIVPSPNDKDVSFIFNRQDGSIFQVEKVTKEILLEFQKEEKDEEKLKNEFIKKYNMDDEDIKNLEDFLFKIKDANILI